MVSRCVALVGSDRGRPRLIREEIVLVRLISPTPLYPAGEFGLGSLKVVPLLPRLDDLDMPDRLRLRARIARAYRVGIVQREASENYPMGACVFAGVRELEREGARSVYCFQWSDGCSSSSDFSPCVCTRDELVGGRARQGSMLWHLQPPHCM